MAAAGAAMPSVRRTGRPEWLESLGGQVLALLAALVIALLAGLGHHHAATARARSTVYGAILDGSFGDVNGFGYVLANADR